MRGVLSMWGVLLMGAFRLPGQVLLSLVLTTLFGCKTQVVVHTHKESRSLRSYRVYTAPSQKQARSSPKAVLFVLHAYATDPEHLVDIFSLKKKAVADRGWLLVVPHGKSDDDGNPYWNASRACCGTSSSKPDDLAYLEGVAADVRQRYQVDTKKEFAIGVSNGGFMAHRWACAESGRLRAIVAISGVGPGPADPPCAPSHPVRVLQVHGDVDKTILYHGKRAGDETYPSARETALEWARLNRLPDTPTVVKSSSFLLGDTRLETWHRGADRVGLWTHIGGGHNLRWLRFEVSEILDFLDGEPLSP